MRPLTVDDLLPLDEYGRRRREFFEAHVRYVNRYRRVRVGPRITLVFENRQTLWFRIQEVLRVARLSEPGRVQPELDLYNRLLPDRDRLQAALLLEVTDESRLSQELATWQALRGEELQLRLDDMAVPADLLTCRPEDRCIGAALWVQFPIARQARTLLEDLRRPAWIEIVCEAYSHGSPPLSEDVRRSLLDDLHSSDRDTA